MLLAYGANIVAQPRPAEQPDRAQGGPRPDNVDRYRRILRYIRRGGVNVNLELVRRGAAAPYFYRGERGRYANALMAAAEGRKQRSMGCGRACPATELEPDHAVEQAEDSRFSRPLRYG
jgi:endonuclease YncB( thermonuclease family)